MDKQIQNINCRTFIDLAISQTPSNIEKYVILKLYDVYGTRLVDVLLNEISCMFCAWYKSNVIVGLTSKNKCNGTIQFLHDYENDYTKYRCDIINKYTYKKLCRKNKFKH